MNKNLIEGEDFYIDAATGYTVLTAKYHLDKGYCCGNGCRHCPYHFEAVPEPRKTELEMKRKNNTN